MIKNHLKTLVLLGALSALVVGLGGVIAPSSLYLFAALALAMNLGAYFFSDRLILKMHGAREVSPPEAPELHRMVGELSDRAQIPKPRVCVIPEAQPNAFATGRNPAHGVVAVTEGIRQLLTERELRAVLAHEIAHIRNRDILVSTIAAVVGTLITTAAQALSFGALFGGHSQDDDDESSGSGGLLVALVAPLAATLIQMGISRTREYMADELGAQLSGDPEALASALLKLEHGAEALPSAVAPATASLFIVNPFGATASLSRWFSTHPQTEERVRRLLAMRSASPPVSTAQGSLMQA